MEKNKLLELTIAELIAIKEHATPEEIEYLVHNVETGNVDGGSPARCVYGTMTGSCWSNRTRELIEKCSSKNFFSALTPTDVHISDKLNDPDGGRFYTPMEYALWHHQEQVIEFIKEIFA